VCLCVHARARAINKHVHAHTNTHTRTRTHEHLYIHMYIRALFHCLHPNVLFVIHTHIHTHVSACIPCLCPCTNIYKNTHLHSHAHTHTFTSCLACIVTRVRAQMLIRVYPHEDTYTERSTEYWQVLCSSVAVCVAGVCVAVCVAGVCIARQGLAAFASSCSQLPLTCCACGMYESE